MARSTGNAQEPDSARRAPYRSERSHCARPGRAAPRLPGPPDGRGRPDRRRNGGGACGGAMALRLPRNGMWQRRPGHFTASGRNAAGPGLRRKPCPHSRRAGRHCRRDRRARRSVARSGQSPARPLSLSPRRQRDGRRARSRTDAPGRTSCRRTRCRHFPGTGGCVVLARRIAPGRAGRTGRPRRSSSGWLRSGCR